MGKMLEVLKIIVLACNVSGSNPFVSQDAQVKCRKALIVCMEKKASLDSGNIGWDATKLKSCLLEEKK
jgi:hypothetical protein